VPVIDLDSPAAPPPIRRSPRVLLLAVAGLLLLGLSGEAAGPAQPFRSEAVCTETTGNMSTAYSSTLVIVTVDSGEVQTTTIYGGC
jgi:hypothetical protein